MTRRAPAWALVGPRSGRSYIRRCSSSILVAGEGGAEALSCRVNTHPPKFLLSGRFIHGEDRNYRNEVTTDKNVPVLSFVKNPWNVTFAILLA